jgi:hypothetical protein
MAEANTEHAGPCTAGASCAGMLMAIDGGGERQLGIHWTHLLNFKTGEVTPRLAYRFPKGRKGCAHVILLNRCPWCGEDVSGAALPAMNSEVKP